MASKTIDSGITREYQLHLIMSEQSQSVANNTTTIAYELRLTSGSYNFSQYGAGWAVWINGTRVAYHDRNTSDRYSIAKNSYWTIASGTTTVTHNDDGTKTITCSASLDMAGSPAPGALSCAETSWTLTTIPRASSMTVPSFTIGSAGTMTISMASSSFSHSITYSFSGLTGTAATVSAGVTSASWTPPTTFYAKLPSSTSGTVTLVLHTYSGSTEIGTASYNATVYVGSGVVPSAPSITLYPVNSNSWFNSKGLYVGGYTRLRVVSSSTAGSGASMSSYSVSNAFTATGADVTSSSALAAGSRTVTVTATDSRGRTNSASKSVSFLTYASPSVSLSAERGTYSNGSWSSNASGDHIRVTATPTVYLTANGNAGTVTVKVGSSSPNATSGNYYYFTGTVATSSYTATASITDSAGNSGSASLSIGVTAVASTMTYGTLNVGESVTFTVSRNNSNFTHTISASLGNQSATVGTGIGTSTSWTIPSGWLSQIPSATSKSGTLTITTYRGSATVGSNSYTATFYVPSSVKPTAPTITLTPVNTNAWMSSNNLYVGGYTKLKVQSSATAGSGASMSSYSVTGAFIATGSNVTSNILTAGAKTVTVTATDSRGRTNSNSASVTFLTYTNPSITTFTAERGTYSGGAWTSDDNGDHIRVTAIPSVALSAQGNTATVTVKIGNTNPDATSGNYYYFTSTSATTSYAVTGSITDSVGNSSSRGLTVPTISVPFNINVDLPGAGFGMIAQKAKTVEIAQDWSLVANGKNNTMAYAPYSWSTNAGAGEQGYLRIATITIKRDWINSPITFKVNRRNDYVPLEIYLFFAGTSSYDPAVETFYVNRDGGGRTNIAKELPKVFITKIDTSVWAIYVEKTEANEELTVTTEVSKVLQEECIDVSYAEDFITTLPPTYQFAVGMPFDNKARHNTITYMPYAWHAYGTAGTAGYARIATVNTNGNTWVQGSITFEITRLIDYAPYHVYLTFEGTSNTDPNVSHFYVDRNTRVGGTEPTTFIYKVDTHKWDVYVQKVSGGDDITVRVYPDKSMQDRATISFSNNLRSSIPSGAVVATPFVRTIYNATIQTSATLTKATTFTLSAPALIRTVLAYASSAPSQIVITSDSGNNIRQIWGHMETVSIPSTTVGSLQLMVPLIAGTYELWVKSASTANNPVTVYEYSL